MLKHDQQRLESRAYDGELFIRGDRAVSWAQRIRGPMTMQELYEKWDGDSPRRDSRTPLDSYKVEWKAAMGVCRNGNTGTRITSRKCWGDTMRPNQLGRALGFPTNP